MTSPSVDPSSLRPAARGQAAQWLPTLGLAAWFAGAVGLGWIGLERGWPVGTMVMAEAAWLIVLCVVARTAVRQMFGPVFTYEAIRLGRKRMTFILRGMYVVGMMGFLGLMYLTWLEETRVYTSYGSRSSVKPSELSEFATMFFFTFEILQFIIVVMLTPAYVAGAITDEKQRKTLEFLLATDLQNREIIFGKLTARVANLLIYVLAGLPILGFLQLFGGIDPEMLLTATLVTVVTVLGLSAMSIYFSTILRKPRDAIGLTYLAAALYAVGIYVLSIFFVGISLTPLGFTVLGIDISQLPLVDVANWLSAGNPAYGVTMMFGGPGGPAGPSLDELPIYLFRFLVFWAVVGSLFLLLAILQLRVIALREPARINRSHGRRERLAQSRPIVGDDPMFWKEVFAENPRSGCAARLMGVIIIGFTFFVPVMIVFANFGDMIPGLVELFGGYRSYRPFEARWNNFVEGMNVWVRIATGVMSALLFLAATVRGAGVVTGEKERDTWISLISTPLGTWEMLLGKWWGVILGMRPVLIVILTIWVLGLLVGALPIFMLPPLLVSLAMFLAAFAWIGVFFSITSRTTLIATVRALMSALFLGGGFWIFLIFCCVMPIALIMRTPGNDDFVETMAQFLLGCTPPFVMGWMPMNEFDRYSLGPFNNEGYDGDLGVFAPMLGVMIWGGFAWVLALVSHEAFRSEANRGEVQFRRVPASLRIEPHSESDAASPST